MVFRPQPKRARQELEASVPLEFQRIGPARRSAWSVAARSMGSLHVSRRPRSVRQPDDFRRNPIGRKSWCAHHRLGRAKRRRLAARPHLRPRSLFPNSALTSDGWRRSGRCRSQRRRRASEANKPEAVAVTALHVLAGDVIAVAVPTALAQTWLPVGDPVSVCGVHRRSQTGR